MQMMIYYTFAPTEALVEAARIAGEDWLLEPDVWIDTANDRTGPRHEQTTIEDAAWTVFLAKLVTDGPENDHAKALRLKCVELGFKGCWKVYLSRAAEPVESLINAAKEYGTLAERALHM